MAGRNPKKAIRGHGEGSIYERKNGKWAGVSRYIDPETGESKRHFVYGKSRKEVVGKKDAWEKEYKNGLRSTKKMTVAQWLDIWLKDYKKSIVRQNTFNGYKIVVDSHLKPSLGHFILSELRVDQVQKMLQQKLSSGRLRNTGGDQKIGTSLSSRMVEYIYSVLYMALDQALKNGLVTRNVCKLVKKPTKAYDTCSPWTSEQTNEFLIKNRNSRLFPVYMVAWGGGLRRSEILGLIWNDVNFDKQTITVKRSLVRIKGGYTIGDTKTEKSQRTIPMPNQVMVALSEWKAQQVIDKIKFDKANVMLSADKRPKFNAENMIFTDEKGNHLKPDYVTDQFGKALLTAGLPKIRFHDLRHGHATMLIELGEDVTLVSKRLGHSTITVTANTYIHDSEEKQREASEKLSKTLDLNQ